MADFPTFGNSEDANKAGFDTEDVGMRSEMEGGYVLTRPRHTRTPRRIWITGFTDLDNSQKLVFEAFWNSHGTYKGFTYSVRTTNEVVNVRFMSKPNFKYAGIGPTYHWDIDDIKLEEV